MTAPGRPIVRIDDAAIKERVRGLLAQAWDEGHKAGIGDMINVIGWGVDDMKKPPPAQTRNPYRDEAQA